MPRGSLLAALLLVAACSSSSEAPPLVVPPTETDYVIFATASAGRSALPQAVRIALAAELSSIRPESIGGGDIDMFFAGLKREDLPADLDPLELEIVAERDDNARRLPELYAPHVLDEPASMGRSQHLVSASDGAAGVPAVVIEERQERFRKLTEGLAIRDPCEQPLTPISIVAPRTPGEDIRGFRTLSSGETFIGVSATSTAIIAAIDPGTQELEVIGVGTGTIAVRPGDKTRIGDLGDTEVTAPDGRILPGEIPLNFIGAFGGIGQVSIYDRAAGKYVDASPIDREAEARGIAPGLLAGVRHVTLNGTPSICAYGGARGPNRVAAIWCRATTETAWKLSGDFREAYVVSEIIERPAPLQPIAFDVTGTVYEYRAGRWTPTMANAVNDGCMPPCVVFGAVSVKRTGGGSGFVAAFGGTHAQAAIVEGGGGGEVMLNALDVVSAVLFKDERRGSEAPVRFASTTFAPDGSLWLGTQEPILVRVSPDLSSAKRICLPKDAAGAEVTAIEAHPEGRLYLGMTPALMGFGDWRQ